MHNITVEIKKRYDSCYNVWQWISLAELFKPTNPTDDTTEVQESIKPSYVSIFSDVLSFKDLENLAKGTIVLESGDTLKLKAQTADDIAGIVCVLEIFDEKSA